MVIAPRILPWDNMGHMNSQNLCWIKQVTDDNLAEEAKRDLFAPSAGAIVEGLEAEHVDGTSKSLKAVEAEALTWLKRQRFAN